MLRILRLIAVLTVIPFLGLGAALARFWTGSDVNLEALGPASEALAACAGDVLRAHGTQACGSETPFGWLAIASAGVLILSFGIVPLSRLVAAALGTHRTILSLGFWPYALTLTIVVGLISLIHAGIFGGATYLVLQHWFGIESGFLLVAIAVVLLARDLCDPARTRCVFVRPKSYIAARPVTFYEYPRLGLVVRDIAKKLNAKMPDNVVIGLQPTFFATSSPIYTPYGKSPLKGQTLYLSLCR